MTVERAIAVCLPLKMKQILTKKRLVLAWFCLFLVVCLINIHFWAVLEFDFIERSIIKMCHYKDQFQYFGNNIWYWIDGLMTFVIPFSILFISNLIIIIKLLQAKKKRDVEMNVGDKEGKGTRTKSTTIMLLVVSFAFLILVSPRMIIYLGAFTGVFNPSNSKSNVQFVFSKSAADYLYYMNNAINFVLYFMSGPRFRNAFLSIICFWRGRVAKGPSTNSGVTSTISIRTQ